jgi:hypothetical protein
LARFPRAYIEISPSGTGLHILGLANRSPFPGGESGRFYRRDLERADASRASEIGVFVESRFFCMTGDVIAGHEQAGHCGEPLCSLAAKLWPSGANGKPTAPRPAPEIPAALGLALEAMRSLDPRDRADGSHRLFCAACTCVGHGLSDADALSVIRAYEAEAPFPKAWSDADVFRRIRDARKRVEREHATEPEPSANGKPESEAEPAEDTSVPGSESLDYQSFPVGVLPTPLSEFVGEGAQAVGCDQVYLALPLLVGCSASIGHTRRLRLRRTWTAPASLWGCIIGESGDKKSPPMELALKSLEELDCAEHQRNEEALAEYAQKLAEFKRDFRNWERGKRTDQPVEPSAPVLTRILIDDVTIEGLMPILRDNPRGVLIYKDELRHWFSSFDRYVSKQGGDDCFWLKVFSNRLAISDRKTSAMVRVRRPFVSLIGAIQPGPLKRVLGIEHLESGMAARLLLAWPPSRPRKWTDAQMPEQTEQAIAALMASLRKFDFDLDSDGKPQPKLVWPTDGALERFRQWHDDLSVELCGMSGALKAAFSKLEEYAARIALVLHCVRQATGETSSEMLDEISMQAGIDLARWFKHEARRCYAMLGESDEATERRKLLEWIERRGSEVTIRQVQMGYRRLRTPGFAEAALTELVQQNFGRWKVTPSAKGGPPGQVFVLAKSALVSTSPPSGQHNPSKTSGKRRCVDVDTVDTLKTNSKPVDSSGQVEEPW